MSCIAAVRVPASSSNLGAGFDCLGLALDLWLEAKLVEGDGQPAYRGTLESLHPRHDLMVRVLQTEGLPSGWRLEAESHIPIGKGLGSSAAAVVAGLALADLARGIPLDRHRLWERASRIENHPDNAGAAIYGGLFLASRLPTRFVLHPSIGVALAIPRTSIDTHAARALLPRQLPREEAVAQAARAAALVLGLTRGDPDLIAFGMEDRIAVPKRKELIPGYDAAAQAGIEAGGFGVTISGAGSALLALAPAELAPQVARALAEALTAAGNPATPVTPKPIELGLTQLQPPGASPL